MPAHLIQLSRVIDPNLFLFAMAPKPIKAVKEGKYGLVVDGIQGPGVYQTRTAAAMAMRRLKKRFPESQITIADSGDY